MPSATSRQSTIVDNRPCDAYQRSVFRIFPQLFDEYTSSIHRGLSSFSVPNIPSTIRRIYLVDNSKLSPSPTVDSVACRVGSRVPIGSGEFPLPSGEFPLPSGEFPLPSGEFPLAHDYRVGWARSRRTSSCGWGPATPATPPSPPSRPPA
eukprot:1176208-Prorocentrum_minimum.AAC.2